MDHQSIIPLILPPEKLLNCQLDADLNLNEIESFGRVLSAYYSPAQMSVNERLFTFGLVMALRPQRVLEIGFRYGGSSFLMLCALEDIGNGRLVAIDPQAEPALDFTRFADRFHLLRGRSPDMVPEAVAILGGPVDFCFVDGDHEYAAVAADLEAVRPHMAADSYLLLHDPMYEGVRRATDEFVSRHRRQVVDCGLVAPHISAQGWSGLRLLRIKRPPRAGLSTTVRRWLTRGSAGG